MASSWCGREPSNNLHNFLTFPKKSNLRLSLMKIMASTHLNNDPKILINGIL